MTHSQPNLVCLTSSLETEPGPAPERQERWKAFAPQIVAEQIKGFDWLGYRACMVTISSIPKTLQEDSVVRELHSRFARILLAFVQLAEADLPTARATWRARVPKYIGMPTFLEENLASSVSDIPSLARHAIDGRPTSEMWHLVRKSIHHRQDSPELFAVLGEASFEMEPSSACVEAAPTR